MTILNLSNELVKEASSVVGSGNISIIALEKKMNEQMSKGSVVFDSALTNTSVTETSTVTTSNETPIQISPPTRISNA